LLLSFYCFYFSDEYTQKSRISMLCYLLHLSHS
jgi:hypothetical protein